MLEVRNILDITRCVSLYTENTRPQPYRPGGRLASQCVLPTDWRVAVGVCWKLVGKISHKEGSAPKTSLLLLCPLVGTTAAYSLHGPWQLVYKHSMLGLPLQHVSESATNSAHKQSSLCRIFQCLVKKSWQTRCWKLATTLCLTIEICWQPKQSQDSRYSTWYPVVTTL